jgi:hypothetical protein
VNGPAPAAAAAAPTVAASQVAAAPPTGGAGGTGNAGTGNGGTAGDTTAATPLQPVADPLSGLPQLQSLGEIAASVSGGTTARELLATPAGRSVAVLVGLLLALLVFLGVHRRLDRSDPKLATAPAGSDVARFR